MSEPEQYTLPRVLEIVRSHAEALGNASEALEATEGKDAVVLAMVGERALKAADALFEIENVRGVQDHAALPEFGDSVQVQLAMCTLPPLVLAVEAAGTNPHGQCSVNPRWKWCQDEAKRISRDLMEWVTKHEPPPDYPTIEVDAAEVFNLSKAIVEDMGEQPFPEGFEYNGLSGSPGHMWRVLHDELHVQSGMEIWYLPKYAELDESGASPFAMLDSDHTTLFGVSPEEVAPYIGGFTPPEKDVAPATEETGSAAPQ